MPGVQAPPLMRAVGTEAMKTTSPATRWSTVVVTRPSASVRTEVEVPPWVTRAPCDGRAVERDGDGHGGVGVDVGSAVREVRGGDVVGDRVGERVGDGIGGRGRAGVSAGDEGKGEREGEGEGGRA